MDETAGPGGDATRGERYLQIVEVETFMLQAELPKPLSIAGVPPFRLRQSNLDRSIA